MKRAILLPALFVLGVMVVAASYVLDAHDILRAKRRRAP